MSDERLLILKDRHCLRDETLTICDRARFAAQFEADQLASIFELIRRGLRHQSGAGDGNARCCGLPVDSHRAKGDAADRLRTFGAPLLVEGDGVFYGMVAGSFQRCW